MTTIIPGKPARPIEVTVEGQPPVSVEAGKPARPIVVETVAGDVIEVSTGGRPGPQGDPGPAGADGAPGPAGADGQGVPTGGTTGQLLRKASATDYDTEWFTGSGGGGIAESFETVSKNLTASGAVIAYSGGELETITYANGVVKTFAYGVDGLSTVTLSGSTPGGIDLIKTFTYSVGELTGWTYS